MFGNYIAQLSLFLEQVVERVYFREIFAAWTNLLLPCSKRPLRRDRNDRYFDFTTAIPFLYNTSIVKNLAALVLSNSLTLAF